jgi:hypothetical protein
MQKQLNKVLVFVVNLLLMVIAVLVIKAQDRKTVSLKTETTTTIDPLSQEILDAQNAISADRERKLRALSSTPQELKKQQITTTTNKTVKSPSSSNTSSKTTKVS